MFFLKFSLFFLSVGLIFAQDSAVESNSIVVSPAPVTEADHADLLHSDTVNPVAPTTETATTISEPNNVENSHPEALHPETPHPEVPHPEAPHPDAPHPEAPHLEAPNLEAPHPEAPHPEAPHPEAPNLETAHPITPHPETPHPETVESRVENPDNHEVDSNETLTATPTSRCRENHPEALLSVGIANNHGCSYSCHNVGWAIPISRHNIPDLSPCSASSGYNSSYCWQGSCVINDTREAAISSCKTSTADDEAIALTIISTLSLLDLNSDCTAQCITPNASGPNAVLLRRAFIREGRTCKRTPLSLSGMVCKQGQCILPLFGLFNNL